MAAVGRLARFGRELYYTGVVYEVRSLVITTLQRTEEYVLELEKMKERV